jgi:hypothetical protein
MDFKAIHLVRFYEFYYYYYFWLSSFYILYFILITYTKDLLINSPKIIFPKHLRTLINPSNRVHKRQLRTYHIF